MFPLVGALVPTQIVVVVMMALIVIAVITVVGVVSLWELKHHHHDLSYSYFYLVLTMRHSKYLGSYLILTVTLRGSYVYYPHFTDEKIEAG